MAAAAEEREELVAVGRITGAHGIKGEVRVESLTDFPDRFEPGSELLLESPAGAVRPLKVLAGREHKGRWLLFLEGVEDRNAAEALRGGWLKVREVDLRELPPGEYYHHQLLGLEAVTEEGEALGLVEEVLPTGSNLVLVVGRGPREVLLPFIDDVVLDVDLEGRRLIVRLLEGLLPGGG